MISLYIANLRYYIGDLHNNEKHTRITVNCCFVSYYYADHLR